MQYPQIITKAKIEDTNTIVSVTSNTCVYIR